MNKVAHSHGMKPHSIFIVLCIGTVFFYSSCKPKKQSRLRFDAVVEQPYEIEAGGEFDPIASQKAAKGGVYTTWGGPYPKSLNYWLDSWHVSGEIMGLLFDSLISMHSKQNRPIGSLAKSWKKESDRKSFVFEIHPQAAWSDGKPILADDFIFYYDTIMNPKHRTTPSRVILNRFLRPQAIGPKTLVIQAKKRYWKAFWDAGFFRAFPKHVWEGKNFNHINFEFPVTNGPYQIAELKRNRYVLLKRQANWWGRLLRYNQNKFNFDYIRYRFMEDRTAAMEAFKKGDFDVYPIYTSSLWIQQTDFHAIKKNWVIRQEIYNKEPKSFQGFAVNLRRAKFQNVRVRRALCHLLDRRLMNDKLMFNQYFLLNSYFPDLYPNNQNPKFPLCEFNAKEARRLMDQAGWKVGKDGWRVKDGKKFEIVFITAMADLRHLNIYVNTLREAGIDASINQLSHAAVTKQVDHFQFDLYWTNTGSSRLRDPEGLFHSTYANQAATSNKPGLADHTVDEILKQLKFEENIDKRDTLLRKLDARLLELSPFVLLWQSDKTRLLYWNRFGTPKSVLDKFNRENAAIVYWWVDEQKEKKLENARKTDQKLKAEKAKVYY